MRRLLLLFLLVGVFNVHAQEKKIVPQDFDVERGNRFQQALQFQNGLVVVYGRSDWFFYSSRLALRFHDQAGNALRERKLHLQVNGQPVYVVRTFANGNQLYFVCATPFTDKSEMGWCVLSYDYASDKVAETVSPGASNALSRGWLLSGDVQVVYARDSSFAAVCVFAPVIPGEDRICNAFVFKPADPEHHFIRAAPLPNEDRHYESVQTLLDEEGSIYMLGKQYKHGAFEIQNGKPNYNYALHRIDDGVLNKVCDFPDTRVLRSLGGVIVDQTFYGNALVADTLLVKHVSVYNVRFPLHNCEDITEQTIPIADSNFSDTTVASFDNFTRANGKPVNSVFERRSVVYNESAKGSGGFAYVRGNALVAVSNSSNAIQPPSIVFKHQRFTVQPPHSIYTFNGSDALYAAYPEYRDTTGRNSVLVLRNLTTNSERTFPLMYADWKKEDEFYVIETTNALVLLQPRMRSYALFRMSLP